MRGAWVAGFLRGAQARRNRNERVLCGGRVKRMGDSGLMVYCAYEEDFVVFTDIFVNDC